MRRYGLKSVTIRGMIEGRDYEGVRTLLHLATRRDWQGQAIVSA